MNYTRGFPKKQGLYDPMLEKDNCGVGFVANVKGEKSHSIIKKGLEILKNMEHRGAVGADPETGDGAGIMVQIPDEYFRICAINIDMELPEAGKYAVGMMFLPKEPALRYQCEGIFERVTVEEGLKVIGWRYVPVDHRVLGETAKGTEPMIRQVFVSLEKCSSKEEVEQKLYIIRKRAENEVRRLVKRNSEYFYVCSFSDKTIVYKGLLLPEQIKGFYLDLNDINFKSAIAMVHQRFSTNTFPTWDLAQPFRLLAHNGEINTIRGNRNWMNAREGVMESRASYKKIKNIFPIIEPNRSDSASLDNMFEFLKADGRSITHSMMMLIPEAYEKNKYMPQYKKDFYEYNAAMLEPWDGPAAVFFTDGELIGAALDRNGLRPAKYVRTKDGLIVMASELGVLKFSPENIIKKGRLEPGKMFVVDTKQGRIIEDEEIKKDICSERAYSDMLKENKLTLSSFKNRTEQNIPIEHLKERQMAFGYTYEDLNRIIKCMAETGKEPIGSMGNDTPLAVLSKKPQLLFSYFRQLFAQVTNPPIDPIREGVVMSLSNYIGSQRSLLFKDTKREPFIKIDSPILSNSDMSRVKSIRNEDFKATTIPITFKYDSGVEGFKEALRLICKRASSRIKEGYNILILSDRKIDGYEAAVPSLLAVSAVHHHLIREKTRTKISIIVETGEARETTHFALLIGYGASAVNPYLAQDTIKYMVENNEIEEATEEEAIKNYIDANNKGLLKILSKMGICTIQSYHGAQIFEALGLNDEFVEEYFTGTPTRIGGIGLEEAAQEVLKRHKIAFNRLRKPHSELDVGGVYSWRKNGEFHLFNPENIYKLQLATRNNDYDMYKQYAKNINNQSENLCTIRGLFEFNKGNKIPIDEVEPISEIVKRFCTGAMSCGSLSKEAHETIAIAMNRLGAKSNCGEGGEDPERYKVDSKGDSKRSAIKQVASGRFGVNIDYLVNADELQIKVAQGAKPGEGGHLPGKKVNDYIAKIRHSTPGIDLISPPPHHDIYSIEDLAQLIHDLKCANKNARVSVKLVSEVGIGTIAAGVAKAHADMILISGHDGGTGAAPLSSIRNAGIPWEIGLSETHQVLLLNNLRSRVRLQTDGQLKTGRDVVIAAMLGAEEFGFATTALVVLGCTLLRQCHCNTCDMGCATQDPELRANFKGKPEHLINFFTFIAMEVREYMAEMGFRTMNEMVGRIDKINVKNSVNHWKTKGLDFSQILYRPDMPSRIKSYCVKKQDHGIENVIDNTLIKIARPALKDNKIVRGSFEIKNTDRSVGAMLSSQIAKTHGLKGMKEDTITFEFNGSAGQSFGAYGANGLTLILNGEANDYVGKGLSGAKIIIKTPENAAYNAEENYIAGNTILYGAVSGKVFINGLVGERFAVRNSGVSAVVEGVGEHCCEYMTGGTVVVMGKTGRNFGAGMSGGTAYVLDEEDNFEKMVNSEMLEIEKPDKHDLKVILDMLQEHCTYTNSSKAKRIIESWNEYKVKFKKAIPTGYKEILMKKKQNDKSEVVK